MNDLTRPHSSTAHKGAVSPREAVSAAARLVRAVKRSDGRHRIRCRLGGRLPHELSRRSSPQRPEAVDWAPASSSIRSCRCGALLVRLGCRAVEQLGADDQRHRCRRQHRDCQSWDLGRLDADHVSVPVANLRQRRRRLPRYPGVRPPTITPSSVPISAKQRGWRLSPRTRTARIAQRALPIRVVIESCDLPGSWDSCSFAERSK